MEYRRRNRLLRLIGIIAIVQLVGLNLYSQGFQLSVGTDIPYQFYVGGAYNIYNLEISYKTGILVSPYSDAILNIVESLGAAPVYIDLLHSAYRFGWMNTVNVSYYFGKSNTWYVGSDIRYDKLTASQTPIDLIELVSGENMINYRWPWQKETHIDLGLNLTAIGFRLGRSVVLGEENKNSIRLELSVAKYISSDAVVKVNGATSDKLSSIFDDLLWEDVFKSYGYVGGVGVSYNHKL